MRRKKNRADFILEICIFIITLLILLILIIQITTNTPRVIKKQIIPQNDNSGVVYSLNNYFNNLNINDFNNLLSKYKDFKIIENEILEENNPDNICLPESEEEINQKTKTPYNPCPKQKKEYADMQYLNIGQIIGLPDKSYIPKDLVRLNTSSSTVKNLCLTKEAKNAFDKMFAKAKKDKIIIKASSAFRGFNTQSFLFSNALATNPRALVSVSKPGHSEHQLGTTVDLTGSSAHFASASDNFENTSEDLWLRENAYLFGFVQSYPRDKESITGYRYEPWHYRYVGKDYAKKIKESNLTITEFLK